MPFVPSLRTKLARWRRLPRAERRIVSRAAFWLLGVDLCLRSLGFGRTRKLLRRGRRSAASGGTREALSTERRAEAERVARLVLVTARHHLYPMTCLRRALVLDRLLAARGFPVEIRIGVRKREGELWAHAWVECEGRPLSEPEAIEERFAALALPSP